MSKPQDANGSDSLAVQLTSDTHWEDLVVIIAVVGGTSMFFIVS